MKRVEIKLDGTVILLPNHQGSNPNSLMYHYYQFARYALEKAIKSGENIHWMHSRRSFEKCLDEINIVANYMNIDQFFLSLGNNTGGATFKYDQSILEAICPREGDGNLMAYPPEESLEFLQSIGYRSEELYSCPVFQTLGEEGYYSISITDQGISKTWVDNEE